MLPGSLAPRKLSGGMTAGSTAELHGVARWHRLCAAGGGGEDVFS